MKILLYIILFLLLIILVALIIPVRATIAYYDIDEAYVEVRYLFFKFRKNLSELMESVDTKEESNPEIVPDEEKKKNPKSSPESDINGVLNFIINEFSNITGITKLAFSKIKWNNTKFHLLVSGEDPMEIAMKTGSMNALVYTAYGTLNRIFNMDNANIAIAPDFMENGWQCEFYTDIKARPISFSVAAIGVVKLMFRFIKIKDK